MKILVCIKRVIDYNVHIRVNTDGTGVDTQNVKMSANPFDAIALEEAVRLKEKTPETTVIAVSIGHQDCQETLRYALAMGADKAVLISTEKNLEPLIIAKLLKNIVGQEKPDLVLLGKQAIDDDCNQTGQMLAGLLNYPQACFISKLIITQVDNNYMANITREIDGGLENLEIQLPAVMTTDLRLNEPRRPSLINIMKAKQKPLDIIPVTIDITELTSGTEILKTSSPTQRKHCVKLKSTEELITYLKQQVKI